MKKAFNFAMNLLSLAERKKNPDVRSATHIQEAIQWLARAQRMSLNGGVSEGFHMYHGWLPPYPETTGYIIETFFNYSALSGGIEYSECALRMADWLLAIQIEDGSIPDSYFRKKMVFDTGMVVFGFVRAFRETGKDKYLDAAVRACNWLIDVQEGDGSWIRHAANDIPHTYYSRAAWSLLHCFDVTKDEKYLHACDRNIRWCLSNQQDNGWFSKASFQLEKHNTPFTHTIAYAIRGVLESGIYLKSREYINAAARAMDNILITVCEDGFIPGTFDRNWVGDTSFTCLTGDAQLACIFFRLAEITGADKYLQAGYSINRYLMKEHNITTSNDGIRGAVAGSNPLWGNYIHFAYPNWAVKFFIDALMMEERMK